MWEEYLFGKFHPDGGWSFQSFFHLKINHIALHNIILEFIHMNKYTVLGLCVPDETVTFGVVEEGQFSASDGICLIRIILFGNADLNIFSFGLFIGSTIGRGVGEHSILVHIDHHVVKAVRFNTIFPGKPLLFFVQSLFLFLLSYLFLIE